MDTLKGISEAINALLGVLGIFLLGYLLLMGFAHKAGKERWFDWEKGRRKSMGKPNIELYSKSSTTELPWKDPSLIQGGIAALANVAWFSLYVVIMLFLGAVEGDSPSIEGVAIYLSYPVAMLAFLIIITIRSYSRQYKLSWKPFLGIVFVSVACAILTFLALALLLRSAQLLLYSQIGLLLIVSTTLSYVHGISDGLKDAEIETRFSVVNAIMNEKHELHQLRLYEKTDLDYRFIGEDGSEYVVPKDKVVMIIHRSNGQTAREALLPNETPKLEQK